MCVDVHGFSVSFYVCVSNTTIILYVCVCVYANSTIISYACVCVCAKLSHLILTIY